MENHKVPIEVYRTMNDDQKDLVDALLAIIGPLTAGKEAPKQELDSRLWHDVDERLSAKDNIKSVIDADAEILSYMNDALIHDFGSERAFVLTRDFYNHVLRVRSGE